MLVVHGRPTRPTWSNGQAAVAHQGGAAARAAPGQRPHARLQFGQGEGLGHVVVGAQVQPLDAAASTLSAAVRISTGSGIARAQCRRLSTSRPGSAGQAAGPGSAGRSAGSRGPNRLPRRCATCVDRVAVVPQRAASARLPARSSSSAIRMRMVVSTLLPASHATRLRNRWGLPSILFFYTVPDIPQAALWAAGSGRAPDHFFRPISIGNCLKIRPSRRMRPIYTPLTEGRPWTTRRPAPA